MIEDYYIDLFYVDLTREPDGTGGFEYAYKIGNSFSGSAVKSSSTEQIVAGVRGEVGEQYNVTTAKNNILQKDDIIMFVNNDNERVFLRINSNAMYTPNQSNQKFKGVTATRIIPDYRVVS